MGLALDSLAKVENELEAVRTEIEGVRGIPNISIGSLQTDDENNFQRLILRERKLERLHDQLGGNSPSTKTRRNVGGSGAY